MGANGTTGGAAYSGSYQGGAVHRFDSGLHRPQRSVIRDALAYRLATTLTGNGRPMLRANGGYLTRIGTLQEPLSEPKDEAEQRYLDRVFIELQGAAPALLIALGAISKFTEIGSTDDWKGDLEIVIYAISNNMRAFVDGRMSADVVSTGDPTADPGIETTLEHTRELLAGQELDVIGVAELRPQSEHPFYSDGAISIWEQRYSVTITTSVKPERANSEVVTSIDVRQGIDGEQPIAVSLTPLEVP